VCVCVLYYVPLLQATGNTTHTHTTSASLGRLLTYPFI